MAILGYKSRYIAPFLAGTTLMVLVFQMDYTSRGAKQQSPSSHCSDPHSDPHSNHDNTSKTQMLTISSNKVNKIKKELNDSEAKPPAFSDGVHPWNYVMNNPNICSDADMVDIIIIVHTAPSHLEKRQNIRQTYANRTKFVPYQIRIAFLLGLTNDKDVTQKLYSEHAAFNDTVMGDFKDDYHNLTLKGVMGYRWISEFCQNSKFVLKIDDDVIINMYKLLNTFRMHMYNKKKSIFCNTWNKNTMGILREGRWKVEPHLFYKKGAFPYTYCSGFMVLFTSDMMRPMFEAAKVVPFFWIDDVYLFGMLPSAVGGVSYYNYALGQNTTLNGNAAMNCTRTLGHACPMFASLIGPDQFMKYWNIIESLYSIESWKIGTRFVQ